MKSAQTVRCRIRGQFRHSTLILLHIFARKLEIPKVRLIFHIFGVLAEFERNLIRERTQAGLEAARARGRKGGRLKALDAIGELRQ